MRVTYGGQAVLEGVMMRSPSSWAVAVRTPEGDITEVVREIESPMKRRRIWRLPVIRGVIALGESLAIGFRALAISANVASQERDEDGRDPDADRPRPDHLLVRPRDRVRAHALQDRPRAPHELAADRVDGALRRRRGGHPRRRLHRLHPRHLAASRPPARLPVPRRRAQDDQRPRGGRRAHASQRAEVQPDPPALRNCVLALGHGHRDLRLRVRRAAGLVLADRRAGSCCCP